MNKFIENIPWDKLGEMATVSVIAIIVIYFIFKQYIDYKHKELAGRIQEVENRSSNELQKIKQEVAQIHKNTLKDSNIDVIKGSQVHENNLENSTIKVR